MCNRYENHGSVTQLRAIVRAINRTLRTTPATDNLAPLDNVYPDQNAPILRNAANGSLELTMARWGFPPIPGQKAPITNIRHLKSKWWSQVNREWIVAREYRCLVPFTAFAEPVINSKWFLVPGHEVACFAGVWRSWRGERLAEQPGQKRRVREERDWSLYSFLTTEANDVVRPVHEKAMPVILIDPAEQTEWLEGGEASLHLQRPLPNEMLVIRSRPP
ncbi:MAG: SOS response-associated peptidase family protein [Alphaproteobacteria bacterium]|nr:SOS response-associated peptidase family protein [Alphaproteobacteria bacterium]